MGMTKRTAEQFKVYLDCAKKVGIFDAVMLGFGGLLGYVRHGSMCPGDNDLDMMIRSDLITPQKEQEFFHAIEKSGLFNYRRRVERNPANGRLFWFSLRGWPDEMCYKKCTWFFWKHHGYIYHNKGLMALVKGVPEHLLEIGQVVEFMGTKVHIPKHALCCLDYWYPGWVIPRKGSSEYKTSLKVKDWSKPKSWKLSVHYPL